MPFRLRAATLILFGLGVSSVAVAQLAIKKLTASSGKKLDVMAQIVAENKANSQGFLFLRDLTQNVGHRLSGSANGAKGEDFVLQRARTIGLIDNKYQPFAMPVWTRQYVELEVVPENSDHFVKYKTVALSHSPLDANVEAFLFDIGNGLEADYLGKKDSVAGKIVVVNIGLEPGDAEGKKNIHRSEKAALAIANGAAGAVFVNGAAGGVILTGTASVDGGLIPIPALCIGLEAGRELRKWLKENPLKATIRMENTFEEKTVRNVVTSMKGYEDKEVIVVGAHLDSWDLATGAVDNGLGSAILFEAARILKKMNLPMKRTVEFAWFMGEEQGLFGSKHYINLKKKKRQLSKVKYMLNFDMAGNAKGWNAGGFLGAEAWLAENGAATAAADTGFKNLTENEPELHSDHQNFMIEGIPVVQAVANMPDKVYACYHADCDNIGLVEPEYVDRTARAAAYIIYQLANAEALPSPVMTQEQTKQFLIAKGLKKQMVLGKVWRWK